MDGHGRTQWEVSLFNVFDVCVLETIDDLTGNMEGTFINEFKICFWCELQEALVGLFKNDVTNGQWVLTYLSETS